MKIVVLDSFTTNPGDLIWKKFARLANWMCMTARMRRR
jgi:hypothetical protein